MWKVKSVFENMWSCGDCISKINKNAASLDT